MPACQQSCRDCFPPRANKLIQPCFQTRGPEDRSLINASSPLICSCCFETRDHNFTMAFLRLPTEIRLEIYKHLLNPSALDSPLESMPEEGLRESFDVFKKFSRRSFWVNKPASARYRQALIQVCRTVHNEAKDIAFQRSAFRFKPGDLMSERDHPGDFVSLLTASRPFVRSISLSSDAYYNLFFQEIGGEMQEQRQFIASLGLEGVEHVTLEPDQSSLRVWEAVLLLATILPRLRSVLMMYRPPEEDDTLEATLRFRRREDWNSPFKSMIKAQNEFFARCQREGFRDGIPGSDVIVDHYRPFDIDYSSGCIGLVDSGKGKLLNTNYSDVDCRRTRHVELFAGNWVESYAYLTRKQREGFTSCVLNTKASLLTAEPARSVIYGIDDEKD